MPEAAMELKNVRKTIGSKEIIKDLSFSIPKGEVFGFIGPNGAGKTTTIRMMVGLMKLSGGDVHILGKSIKSDFKHAVREVGAIVENPEMYTFMSGWKNLLHYARMTPGVTNERIREVVKLVRLETAINEKVGRYSLGMRQRLGIAQALLHSPSVLILDEPTNGLDPAGIKEIRQYIRRIANDEGIAVIISSHLLSEIELMCDRIGVIQNGELIATQNVQENDEAQETAVRSVQLEADPLAKAQACLKEQHELEVTEADGMLTFESKKEDIPAVAKTLIEADIAIYQINVKSGTLEDKFFDLIGENTIE